MFSPPRAEAAHIVGYCRPLHEAADRYGATSNVSGHGESSVCIGGDGVELVHIASSVIPKEQAAATAPPASYSSQFVTVDFVSGHVPLSEFFKRRAGKLAPSGPARDSEHRRRHNEQQQL